MQGCGRRFISFGILVATAIAASGCGSKSSVSVTAPSADVRCAVTTSGAGSMIAATGGSGALAITTSRECSWSAKSSVDWIALGSSASGQGNGKIGRAHV